MNAAAAGNGENTDVEQLRTQVADLQVQRATLLAEVTRLKNARNEAMQAAIELQQEVARLRARITELEGGNA
jgi:uncharacterized coiled-coil DUF342 family protein